MIYVCIFFWGHPSVSSYVFLRSDMRLTQDRALSGCTVVTVPRKIGTASLRSSPFRSLVRKVCVEFIWTNYCIFE